VVAVSLPGRPLRSFGDVLMGRGTVRRFNNHLFSQPFGVGLPTSHYGAKPGESGGSCARVFAPPGATASALKSTPLTLERLPRWRAARQPSACRSGGPQVGARGACPGRGACQSGAHPSVDAHFMTLRRHYCPAEWTSRDRAEGRPGRHLILGGLDGGRQEARTPDLRVANAALSQLS
jgi:hypothetical protein